MKRLLPAIFFLALLGACSREVEILESRSFLADGEASVFEQTRQRFAIEYDSLEFGMFITAIAGASQSRKAFWLYSVNSERINLSSDKYFPDPGDTIQWQLVSVY